MPLSTTLPLLAVRMMISVLAKAEIEFANAALRSAMVRRSLIIENP